MRPWASVGLSHSSRSSSLDAGRGTRLSRRSALTSASPHCSEAAEKRKSLGWNLLACRLGGSSPALRDGRTARQSLARDRVAFDRRGAAAVATGQTRPCRHARRWTWRFPFSWCGLSVRRGDGDGAAAGVNVGTPTGGDGWHVRVVTWWAVSRSRIAFGRLSTSRFRRSGRPARVPGDLPVWPAVLANVRWLSGWHNDECAQLIIERLPVRTRPGLPHPQNWIMSSLTFAIAGFGCGLAGGSPALQ